jgi:hypothetical protein
MGQLNKMAEKALVCKTNGYAILRSIPNKLGGIVALAFSILILLHRRFLPVLLTI